MDSIKASGFVSVDRLVVKELKDHEGCYVVLEGNRRTTACKLLSREYKEGGSFELEPIIDSIESLECLVYSGDTTTSKITSKIQGLRHITRTKDWSPYSQAKHIENLMKSENMNAKEIHDVVGIPKNDVTRSLRGLRVFEQAIKENKDDCPAIEDTNNFSIFYESVGKSKVWQNYLKWDDTTNKVDPDKLALMVEGCMPSGDNPARVEGAASDIRLLGKGLTEDLTDMVDKVFSGDKTIGELRNKLEDSGTKGLQGIISSCDDTATQLGNLTIDHMRSNKDKIADALTKLENSIQEAKKRVKT
jgi:hypothetical protein